MYKEFKFGDFIFGKFSKIAKIHSLQKKIHIPRAKIEWDEVFLQLQNR